jgi:hypothetical protein
MSRAGRRLAGVLLLAFGAGCAGPEARVGDGRQEVSVEAEGWAPVAAGENELSLRHRALAEAQKKAVEKVVGVTLRARTRVEDAVSIRQSIVANMGGTIRRYEILSEAEEDGFFKVRIRADVLYVPVAAAAERRRTPRYGVRIAVEKVAGAVRSALASRDLDLAEGDVDADVKVTGVVETRGLADPRLGGFYSYNVRVALSAASTRTGKVTQLEAAASAVDLDDRVACDMALEKAGFEAGTLLAASFAEKVTPAEEQASVALPGFPGF